MTDYSSGDPTMPLHIPTSPRTGPGSRTGKAARSGPSLARSARLRPAIEITLSPAALSLLDSEKTRTGESRSALVESLVISNLRAERYLPPALLERAQGLADRTGQSLDLVLASALALGLDQLGR